MSEDEIKEKNRLRAKLTRKRKANYYKDIEAKNKILEQENEALKKQLEDYKKKEYEWTLSSLLKPEGNYKTKIENSKTESGIIFKNYLNGIQISLNSF